jgi:nitrous oxidase accessory protein
VFDHLRGNLLAADLMAQGTAAFAIAAAEQSFPVLQPVTAVDHHPLIRPPSLPDVPAPDPPDASRARGAAAASALVSLVGVAALARLGVRPDGRSAARKDGGPRAAGEWRA